MCVCVCEKERENGGGGGGGREGEKEFVCVCEFCVICWYQYFRQKYVLEERVLISQRNPDPPSCSHYNLRRHMEYILTLTSLSLSHQIHTFSRFHYKLCSYGLLNRNR